MKTFLADLLVFINENFTTIKLYCKVRPQNKSGVNCLVYNVIHHKINRNLNGVAPTNKISLQFDIYNSSYLDALTIYEQFSTQFRCGRKSLNNTLIHFSDLENYQEDSFYFNNNLIYKITFDIKIKFTINNLNLGE